ncbi:MAG TPA: tetrahydrofolate dehydrogenase/cyclohydrolase catalytic domain-containing protein, partial [Novosphingobium sp.]|nr:tetrahydrofolate dehydrogenase/cyclohydrolase catalytic domain-containing protein [Novosphingobium sp.]
MSNIIDGKAFADRLAQRYAGEVAKMKEKHGITPGLAVVLVGENPASQVYVRNKTNQTAVAG